MSKPDTERVITPMPTSLLEAIDDYRYGTRVPSRPEAIRRLLAAGLKAEQGRAAELKRQAAGWLAAPAPRSRPPAGPLAHVSPHARERAGSSNPAVRRDRPSPAPQRQRVRVPDLGGGAPGPKVVRARPRRADGERGQRGP